MFLQAAQSAGPESCIYVITFITSYGGLSSVIYHGFEPQTIRVAIGMPRALTIDKIEMMIVSIRRVLVTGYLT